MCERAVEDEPGILRFVPDHLKGQEAFEKAVDVSDLFVTQQQIKIWHDDDRLIKWYDGYKKRSVQKAKVKEELMPIAWNPSRWWGWCVSEDEKRRQKNCGHKHGLFCVW